MPSPEKPTASAVGQVTADAWVRFTTRGTLHFLGAGDRTTPCGVPALARLLAYLAAEHARYEAWIRGEAAPQEAPND